MDYSLYKLLDTLHANQLVMIGKLNQLLQQETKVMAEIDDMVAEITTVKGTEDSAVLLITRLIEQVNTITQSATDLATLKQQIAAATKQMADNAVPLATAVAANPGPTA